jgi:hypothetical protein
LIGLLIERRIFIGLRDKTLVLTKSAFITHATSDRFGVNGGDEGKRTAMSGVPQTVDVAKAGTPFGSGPRTVGLLRTATRFSL